MTLDEVLKKYYAEEINVSITSFFDEGWDVKIGDEINGFKTHARFTDFDLIASWLDACLPAIVNGVL